MLKLSPPKLFFQQWIDAIQTGNLATLEALHTEDPDHLPSYRSAASHGLPCPGMNSAHVAALAGRPKILAWIEGQMPELLDQPAEGGLRPWAQCVEGLSGVPCRSLPALSRFVQTLRLFGMKRLHPGLPRVLRRIAAEAWRAKQDGQAEELETCLDLLRELLADTRAAFGDDVAREAALDVSGLEPAWELLRETDSDGGRTEAWAERALVRALENHPEPDARAFFEAVPPGVAERLNQRPGLLNAGWHRGDGNLARFLLAFRPEAKPEAISAALKAEDLAVVLAALNLAEAAPPSLPFRYLLWHLALGRSVCAAAVSRPADDFRLYYTPRYLWNVWSDLFPGLSADEAEGDLMAATAEAYRTLARPSGVHWRDPLSGFAGLYVGSPIALPFLVVSVIAASRMETGQRVTASNYYDRLGQVLGYDLNPPPSFVSETFRDLWEETARWLPAPSRLHLPPAGFVDIPQEHVLLREADLDRLDRYFDARRFQARELLPPERLEASFTAWAGNNLTGLARQALGDVRRPAILRQVSQELSRWDGSVRENDKTERTAAFSRAATLELRLYPMRLGQYEIQIAAAQPDGFPDTFPNVLGVAGTDLEADGAGAYSPIPINTEEARQALARKVKDGWQTALLWEGRRLRLSAPERAAIPFRESEDDVALVAAPSLPLRASAHLLCHESVAVAVEHYLDAACGPLGYRRTTKTLLPGWVFFQDVRVNDARVELPEPISHLKPETDVEVRFEGGLRLGRGQEWLCQAPPSLRFSGDYHNLRLNGEAIQADDSGLVRLEGRLSIPRPVLIEADGFKTEIRLVEPCRHERTRSVSVRAPVFLYPLVPGDWALLGAVPGQVELRRVKRGDGEIVALPFIPQWILNQDGPPRVYACEDGAEGGAQWGEEKSTNVKALRQWADLVRPVRSQFRSGRFSNLSQKKVATGWLNFCRDNGIAEPPLVAPASEPTTLKSQAPKSHARKGKKRR